MANPLGADVLLDEHHVTAAMFGNRSFRVPIDAETGAAYEQAEKHWVLEDYGVFRSLVVEDGHVRRWENRNPHISAVVVVHERTHAQDWRDEVVARHRAADASMEAAIDCVFAAYNEIDAAVARGEEPEGAYQWVSVYELDGEDALPLPAGWFDGRRDERYGFRSESTYGRLCRDPRSRE